MVQYTVVQGVPTSFEWKFFFKNFKFVKLEFWYFLSKKNRQIEKADYNKQTFTNFSAFVILTDFLLYIQNLLEHHELPQCLKIVKNVSFESFRKTISRIIAMPNRIPDT